MTTECVTCGAVDCPHLVRILRGPVYDAAAILDWLARAGYGVDYWNADASNPAPFTRRALAEAYHRIDPSCTVEEWDYVLANETGAEFADA